VALRRRLPRATQMKHSRYYLLAIRMETIASSMAITTKTINIRMA
jgi:hypothetical protein